MTFKASWQVPTYDNSTLELTSEPGEVSVLLGPNGSGKSALLYWLGSQGIGVPLVRIVAHRRIWLESSGPTNLSADSESTRRMLSSFDKTPQSRITGQYEASRNSNVLLQLLGAEVDRNSKFVELSEANKSIHDIPVSILGAISSLMSEAGLNLRFSITDKLEFEAIRGDSRYPISTMSDGEKAAFLLAAEVLLAPPGSIQLLDEPERHLHRAISARLISSLISSRSDCGFIVSTHDLDLVGAVEPYTSGVYLVETTRWDENSRPRSWAVRAVPPHLSLSENVRRALLGGRQRIIFVEGDSDSLDAPLLNVLFPRWTIYPVGGNDNVQKSVQGLYETDQFHWTRAVGIVDGDTRSGAEADALYKKKVLVLPVNEIENLYYLPWVIEAQAEVQAKHLGASSAELLHSAISDGLAAMRRDDIIDNLAAVNATKILRRKVLGELPSKNELQEGKTLVTISLESPFESERTKLQKALSDSDFETVVKHYSIRDSGFRRAVARALKYPDVHTYQAAVLMTLREQQKLQDQMRGFLGSLPE